ncbi:MAG: F0F1 ATP synthase subunit B [Oscillospiraceae bacterium]|nr:F0F1 ATP synthase subunit B [Oscillospiraceae bacterium]
MGPGEFLNINFFTALFTLINTVTLFLVLKKFLWGPVMKMIEDRQKEIDDMYTEAGNAKDKALQAQAEYEHKLAEARQTGERIVKEATVRGHARQEEILRAANEEADAVRKKAEADIAREKKKAINDAKSEIADIALEIAGKVVGRSLTEQDQKDLVNGFIDQLGDGE